MKPACIFDWDGTLRRGITALAWMEFLQPHLPNAKTATAGMKELLDDYRSGEVNYRYLVRKAAGLYSECIRGAAVSEVAEIADRFTKEDETNLFGFARPVLQTAKERGLTTILVSGAPLEVLLAYQQVLPIDNVFGLVVERQNGVFNGTILANNGLMGKKREVMQMLLTEGYRIVLAAGNSTSDLPLLEHAEQRFLIADEQEVKAGVKASFVDTTHAEQELKEAIWTHSM